MYIAACNNSFKLLDMTNDLASKEESSNCDTSQVQPRAKYVTCGMGCVMHTAIACDV